MAKVTPDGRGDLYRMYDDIGRLLYVGISTTSALHRIKRHAMGQRWWAQVSEIQIERVKLDELADAERHAIIVERPVYNVMHNTSRARAAYRPTKKATHRLADERVARMLDVSVYDVRSMVRAGLIGAVKVGNAWRLDPADVQRIMTEGTPGWYDYSVSRDGDFV